MIYIKSNIKKNIKLNLKFLLKNNYNILFKKNSFYLYFFPFILIINIYFYKFFIK